MEKQLSVTMHSAGSNCLIIQGIPHPSQTGSIHNYLKGHTITVIYSIFILFYLFSSTLFAFFFFSLPISFYSFYSSLFTLKVVETALSGVKWISCHFVSVLSFNAPVQHRESTSVSETCFTNNTSLPWHGAFELLRKHDAQYWRILSPCFI